MPPDFEMPPGPDLSTFPKLLRKFTTLPKTGEKRKTHFSLAQLQIRTFSLPPTIFAEKSFHTFKQFTSSVILLLSKGL
jgi:hypothetical protein